MQLPVNGITNPKLPICASSPRIYVVFFSNSKCVSPPTWHLNYFLSRETKVCTNINQTVTDYLKKIWLLKKLTNLQMEKIKRRRVSEFQLSGTWSWGNFTCTGEQRSTLSPTPTCPNYNQSKNRWSENFRSAWLFICRINSQAILFN